jgi:DNA replication protein DnaC
LHIVSSSYPVWHGLGAAFRENQPPHAMKMLTQPRPLIVDEVGYLGLGQAGTAMLFQVNCNRYKKRGHHFTSSRDSIANRLEDDKTRILKL